MRLKFLVTSIYGLLERSIITFLVVELNVLMGSCTFWLYKTNAFFDGKRAVNLLPDGYGVSIVKFLEMGKAEAD